ncbi:unnamed protein product [Linum trigynum]|uniref:Uncharacterized protein n=1 Tax=Linum trigynum TaxID=586398 RepID=A0AAV2E424_9ROSI
MSDEKPTEDEERGTVQSESNLWPRNLQARCRREKTIATRLNDGDGEAQRWRQRGSTTAMLNYSSGEALHGGDDGRKSIRGFKREEEELKIKSKK